MRTLYRALLILVLLAIFLAAFFFVTANTQMVTLDMLIQGWRWQVSLGVLAVGLLAVGLLAGLLTGLGFKGLRGLFGSRS
ncbi:MULTISPECIES: lipopolysaccharide assembly protein LapA domain-containing protein [Alloalcanivorax]|jgi:lipopolysaccharide assembly protein A|uniref:Lipopolysaccharide assembly protein LapA domain-containing protein n=2 Tax=Alloalcanivorax TaxID=3020832 RepID=A0A9Q3W3B0_9GAMM|nr:MULTISPECIES: lipopolysaccharide assembly protein LapA domain-containing protein [Alloalcanivorax]ERS11686.1 hypothetical protein Q668_02450 [Alcanivorax sp. PN-3]KYZ87686.1 hypothetical protein A3Q32_10895 [Alcanivorax sp. KX64203]MBA4720572.1 DUF1049 domain-containing protein [Alcanivorax sp.]ARB46339.1 hypothetical protein P40_13795 [Alloalcanivorax xenomutans]MCE7507850.1 lipopolysaccharide assembly protein LapA domain-containing protein [Alloalcanivorax xenomutans]|tara:strand:+ start:404 stop:643 length:240 start_codon:yes stop_codon:yes gene_type:complete